MDLEKRVDKIERRIEATTNLIQTGMKMLVKQQEETRELKRAVHSLIEAQMRTDEQMTRTDAKLERLIDALSPATATGSNTSPSSKTPRSPHRRTCGGSAGRW